MITSTLIRCSGADAELLTQCPVYEQIRYRLIGGIMVGTAVLAFCSSSYFLFSSFKNLMISLIFGLIWALIIFNLDMYLVLTIDNKQPIWKKTLSGLPRMMLAILIAFFISEMLILEFFNGEINEQLSSKLENEKVEIGRKYDLKEAALKKEIADKQEEMLILQKQAEDKYDTFRKEAEAKKADLRIPGRDSIADACNIAEKEYQDTKTSNETKIVQLKARIEKERNWAQALNTRHLNECAGLEGTMLKGEGKECIRTKEAWQTAEREYKEIRGTCNSKINELEQEIAQKQKASLACQQKVREKSEQEFEKNRETIVGKMNAVETDIREKERLMYAEKKLLRDEYESVRQKNTEEIIKLRSDRQEEIARKIGVASDGPLARLTALTALTSQNLVLQIFLWILRGIFIVLDTAPILAKIFQKAGVYDLLVQNVGSGFALKQNLIHEVEHEVVSKEYELQRLKKLSELDNQEQCHELTMIFQRYQAYSNDFISYADKFFEKITTQTANAAQMNDPKLKQMAESCINDMTDSFELVQDNFFQKVRKLFDEDSEQKSSQQHKRRFAVYN